MDKPLLNRKLTSLRRCLDRIQEKTPVNPEILKTDLDRQDIIGVNLERAIQICVDIASHLIASRRMDTPGTMAECFTLLAREAVMEPQLAQSLARAVGFRNIAVHEYDQMDWNRVFSLITRDLHVFQDFGRWVTGLMD